HDLLAAADRVHVRCVEEGDPGVQGVLEDRARLVLLEHPRVDPPLGAAEAHRAQAQARDLQPGPAQLRVLHGLLLRCAAAGVARPMPLCAPVLRCRGRTCQGTPPLARTRPVDRRPVPGNWYGTSINSGCGPTCHAGSHPPTSEAGPPCPPPATSRRRWAAP